MAHISDGQDNHGSLTLLVAGMLIAMSGRLVPCQTSSTPPPVTPPMMATPLVQMPAYEVATIKPWDGTGWGTPLRVYIQEAFGIPPNTTGWVIGPAWISSAKYVIQGKPPDAIRDAMQTMTATERKKEVELMMQSLLTDRFKLKAHFETREMPVYQLVPEKRGPTLKENPDLIKSQVAVGTTTIRGKAAPMRVLIDALESVPDIGGHVVIDKTGLTGTYDFSLKWSPMDAPAATGGDSGTAPSPDAERPSLFTAVQEQLGLKLIWTKGPGQVLVIDQIEHPSEN
jgi:uncharacterized protein (TIGR03435 family)